MSELKNQLNLCKIDKIVFAPYLPSDNFDTGSSADLQASELLQQNYESLEQLLQSNMFAFCSQLVLNDDLIEFLVSYLNHRAKPYVSLTSNYTDLILSLDKQVFLLFLRLTSPTKEHRALPSLYPKPALTVYHNNVIHDGLTPAVVDFSAIDQQYAEFVSTLGLLKMHHVIDLVSILSENNRDASVFLMDSMFNAKPIAFNKEVCGTVSEIHRATVQLAEATVALHQKLFDKPTINSTSKAKKVPTAAVANSSAVKPQDQPGNKLHFLASFVVDIVYSYSCWLDAASNVLPKSDLMGSNGHQLSSSHGVTLWNTLKLVYEVILPLLVKIHKQGQKKSSSQSSVVLSALQSTEVTNFLAIVQRKTLHCVHSLLTACSADTHASQSTSVSASASTSWEELLQSKLNLQGILESHYKELSSGGKKAVPLASTGLLHVVDHVSVDDSALMLGVMVSDFLKHNDTSGSSRADNVSLLTAVLSASSSSVGSNDDTSERVQYLLKSLETEDSVYSLIRSKPRSTVSGGGSSSSNAGSSSTEKSRAQSAAAAASEEAFETIKAIFPDLGEGFIEACLQVYQYKSEQVIDALLSNNLNPKLAFIDRKMQKMWKGKHHQEIAMYSAGGVGSKEATRNEKKADLAFKENQKARIRAAEKQEEYDSYIIMSNTQVESVGTTTAAAGGKTSGGPLVCKIERDDYNDDYDDQYDDYIPSSKPLSVFKQMSAQPSSTATAAVAVSSSSAASGARDSTTVSSVNKESSSEFYATEDEEEEEVDPDHLEAEDFEAPDEDSDRDQRQQGTNRLFQNRNQQQMQQNRKSGSAASSAGGNKSTPQQNASVEQSSGVSASKAKRLEKKANKATSGSKTYTEEDRAAMIKQMNETKRFNSLLKDDEAEDAYWESMRNTNHAVGNRINSKDSWKVQQEDESGVTEGVQRMSVSGGRPSGTAAAAAAGGASVGNSSSLKDSNNSGGGGSRQQQQPPRPPSQQNQQKPKGSGGESRPQQESGSKDTEGEGNKKKYHKKTYDKHHQQDKANRKFGSFQPAT